MKYRISYQAKDFSDQLSWLFQRFDCAELPVGSMKLSFPIRCGNRYQPKKYNTIKQYDY